MKFFKKIVKVVLSLLILVTITFFAYSKHNSPTYSGELMLHNLSNTATAYFDENGLPIYHCQK